MIFYIVLIVFGVLFLIFDLCMIWDQYTTLKHAGTVIDFKRKKFVEKRTIGEVLLEVFGDRFNLQWFLPITQGGFYKYYNKSILKAEYTYEAEENEAEEKVETILKTDDDKKND